MMDNAPITLAEAAADFFGGRLTHYDLMKEMDKGRLKVEFFKNGQYYTTLLHLKAFFQSCRVHINPPTACVYVVGYGDFVKIGVTGDFKARLRGLQGGVPEPLQIYKIIDGGNKELERHLHKRFRPLRIKGEWFKKSHSLAKWIEAGCPVAPQ